MALTFIRIEHVIKFNNMKEATREADTLRINIKRYAQKHKIPCTAMIGISHIDIRNAEVVLVKEGKHRPSRKVLSKIKRAGAPEGIEPHLHVIIICKTGYVALSQYLITKIQSRFQSAHPDWISNEIEINDDRLGGYNHFAEYYSIGNPLYYIKYVARQSSVIRYVDDYTNEIEFDFKWQVRHALKVVNERTYFNKKMRKNYVEPSEKYYNSLKSKFKSNSNKFTYLKNYYKTNMLCEGSTGKTEETNTVNPNSNNIIGEIW